MRGIESFTPEPRCICLLIFLAIYMAGFTFLVVFSTGLTGTPAYIVLAITILYCIAGFMSAHAYMCICDRDDPEIEPINI